MTRPNLPCPLSEIWERHDLTERDADSLVSGVVCILYDALNALEFALSDIEALQAVTSGTLEIMRNGVQTAEDACTLAADANKLPLKGIVELNSSGALVWRAL